MLSKILPDELRLLDVVKGWKTIQEIVSILPVIKIFFLIIEENIVPTFEE